MENNNKQHNVALKQEDIDGLKQVQTRFQEKFGVKLTHSQTVRMLTKTWLDDNRVSKELNNER